MLRIKDMKLLESKAALEAVPQGKVLINTINAHSYNVAQHDELFAEALKNSDCLIPDGASIVKACRWLHAKSQPKERIAGWDLFAFEMTRLEQESKNLPAGSGRLRAMFMGSSEKVLALIKKRAASDYPHLDILTYFPPYKPAFSAEDSAAIVSAINHAAPNLLWIGMTAPKQEKWAYSHWKELHISCHTGTIGAVFDFYAGTANRAPVWWQKHSLEWLYRLLSDPRRLWKRYLVGNPLFIWNIMKEK